MTTYGCLPSRQRSRVYECLPPRQRLDSDDDDDDDETTYGCLPSPQRSRAYECLPPRQRLDRCAIVQSTSPQLFNPIKHAAIVSY